MTCKVIKVKIKTEDKTYQQDFLEYDDFTVSDTDPTIERLIKELKDSIKGELVDPEYFVTIKMSPAR